MTDRKINILMEILKNCIEENIGVNDPNVSFEVDYENIADHLLANGVIVPPCKVGDKVFWATTSIDENCEEIPTIEIGEVESFSLQKEGLWAYCRYESGLTYWHLVADYFGKTVFLTKGEAEEKLKEREG